jgi:hypothetical protein
LRWLSSSSLIYLKAQTKRKSSIRASQLDTMHNLSLSRLQTKVVWVTIISQSLRSSTPNWLDITRLPQLSTRVRDRSTKPQKVLRNTMSISSKQSQGKSHRKKNSNTNLMSSIPIVMNRILISFKID